MFFNEYLAMATFALVMAFTPGPNNIMLAASGVNFGFMRSVPHLAGVIVGFALLVVACGVGLGLIFNAAPALQLALKIAGGVYMLWLAFKVATAHRSDSEGVSLARPLTFWQAWLFQWINPKGLIAALSAIAIYVRPGHERQDFAVMLIVFAIVTLALGAHLDGVWCRAAPVAAKSGPCANIQHFHGRTAGREHRTHGGLKRDTIGLVGRAGPS